MLTNGLAVLKRAAVIMSCSAFLTGWGRAPAEWPHSGSMPDEAVRVPRAKYAPVEAGTKSYRPVEPMPWGDINKKIAPAEKPPEALKPEASKPESPDTEPPKTDAPKAEPPKTETPKMDEHRGHKMQ